MKEPENADRNEGASSYYGPLARDGMVTKSTDCVLPSSHMGKHVVRLGEEPDHAGQTQERSIVATCSNYTSYTPNPSRAGCNWTEASADHGVESQFIENSPVALAESKRPKIVFNMKGNLSKKF